MDEGEFMQIGEVAERTSLSLRTIRYYEEVGLVVPSGRSQGRFRLYSEADVRRLWLIRKLKPLDLSLDQIRELLAALDRSNASDIEPRRGRCAALVLGCVPCDRPSPVRTDAGAVGRRGRVRRRCG